MNVFRAILVLTLAAATAGGADAPAGGATLRGKLMCGYQGWFRCEGDGAGNGWRHYGGKKFAPGACGIDLWPDVSELGEDETFATPFSLPDGSPAKVFSSHNAKTVRRHFEWMRTYGIDGVFVQRFVSTVKDERSRAPADRILGYCRDSAAATGRLYAVMYDLSGGRPGEADTILADWKRLRREMDIAGPKDKAYLVHRGKPVVALWGLGFADRSPLLDDWAKMADFFKNDREAGPCTLMLGVPRAWRTLQGDCLSDPRILQIIAKADIVSPWTVGRYADAASLARHVEKYVKPDLAWCAERKLDYLPVAFPGFSWHNLMKGRGQEAKSDQIPRRGGRFFWSQCLAAQQAGASMLYVAMFDEMDEGTAIFKCTNNPPTGASPFVTYEGLPSDHYLWLAGQAGKLLRGEIPASETLPARK